MKEWAAKAFKFVGASIGVLVAAYTVGWSGAITLHSMFKSERVEAENFVEKKIAAAEDKFMAIHRADINGLNGKVDILIKQNGVIISQNYRTRKAIEAQNPE